MGFLVVCLAFGFLCGYLAKQKNRHVLGWFILGCLFNLLALIVIVFLKEVPTENIKEEPMKKCPFCAEDIRLEAQKCRYCGEMLPERNESEEFFESLDRKPLGKDWEKKALNKG